jgi:hypothetical protein
VIIFTTWEEEAALIIEVSLYFHYVDIGFGLPECPEGSITI